MLNQRRQNTAQSTEGRQTGLRRNQTSESAFHSSRGCAVVWICGFITSRYAQELWQTLSRVQRDCKQVVKSIFDYDWQQEFGPSSSEKRQVNWESSLLWPIFTFLDRWWPLVAVIIITATKEEFRKKQYKKQNVQVGWTDGQRWVILSEMRLCA